ncbi:pirin family protein [Mycobacterium sp. GA-2829]|uniref:pirin family protein n=1 Tax=Mycobacterium sp. GA-2829 TaxID=1772283 RepID=UPI0007404C7D|nr:pirin family protein [Mycobacterium sp. GA-2829]KUI35519.1 pirin [Mycobacterium sp. GA-2829]
MDAMGDVEVITSRAVPLGGPRAMTVRRTLPQRARSTIGAWCFADHYGPDDVGRTGGMDVPPHPHTGLQTVSWLFEGEIEHRDSSGVHALVRPGELNLMTGGHGVAHSEVSTHTGRQATATLHGVQLWVVLPDHARDVPRRFDHTVPPPVRVDGATARVLLGTFAGHTSPVVPHTPLLGAELVLDPRAEVALDVAPEFEHGVLVDLGPVLLDGTELVPAELGYMAPGAERLTLTNPADQPARVMLLGGVPFTEPVLMWWNFIGRTHDEIVGYRAEWEAQSERFGQVRGYDGRVQRLPAPPMPGGRLKPRLNPPAGGDPSAWG